MWMPFYIGDYLADTGHLTAQQHGCYMLMLMHQWRTGPLPDDDHQLASIAHVGVKTWKQSVRKVVLHFFQRVDGQWSQKRLASERIKTDKVREERRKSGVNGAGKRWKDKAATIPNGIANAIVLPSIGDSKTIDNHNHNYRREVEEKESLNGVGGGSGEPIQREPPKPRLKPRSTISADWKPTPPGIEFAKARQLNPDEVQKFRDYHLGKGSLMADWNAAWRTWCTKAAAWRANAGLNPDAPARMIGGLD